MDIDEVLNKLGKFGKWQILQFTMLGLAVMIPSAFHALAIVFIGYTPPHRCKITGDLALNESIPYEKGQLSSCKMFVNYSQGNETMDCVNGWEYLGNDGPTIVTKWNLVCGREVMVQASQASFAFGVMIGAVVFSGLSDKYGRKPVFMFSQMATVVVGVTTAFTEDLYVFFLLRLLSGAFQQGILLPGFVLMCELFASKHRTFVAIMIEIFWSLAACLYPLIAYLTSDWVFLQLFISLFGLLTIPLFKCLPESVMWLCANNKTDQATEIIQKAIKLNDIQFHENLVISKPKILKDKESNPGSGPRNGYTMIDIFRSKRMAFYLISCSILWMVVTLVYYGLTLSTAQMAGNRYWNAFFNGLVEFPAVVALYAIVSRFGRKWPMFAFWIATGVPLLIGAFVPLKTESGIDLSALSITLNMAGKFGITCAFNTLILYGSELFPTNLRGQAIGICSCFGRIGSLLSSFSSYIMEKYAFMLLLGLGISSISSAFLVLFLPETHNRPLPETIEDVEALFDKTKIKDRPINFVNIA